MRPYVIPPDFFVGAVVCKEFRGRWFEGKVDRVTQDECEVLWHITYTDFDEEEFTLEQLAKHLWYHPLLNDLTGPEVPEVGEFVWFAEGTQPRLGKVVSVDPSVPRPVLVNYYVPRTGARDISKAIFILQMDAEERRPCSTRLTVFQVRLRFPSLTARGFLSSRDRRRLLQCISS